MKKNIVVNYSNLFEELKNLISESEKKSQTKINSININVPATDSFSEYYDSQIIINDEKISDLHLKKAINESFASAVAAGCLFVYYGSNQAELLNYPNDNEILEIYYKFDLLYFLLEFKH